MKIKKTKRLPNSRWSVKIEESYKGCRESERYFQILFDGKIIMYMNYHLGKYRDVIAERLVSALNRSSVVVQTSEFDDDLRPAT